MKIIIAILLVILALPALIMWACLRVAAQEDARMHIDDSADWLK